MKQSRARENICVRYRNTVVAPTRKTGGGDYLCAKVTLPFSAIGQRLKLVERNVQISNMKGAAGGIFEFLYGSEGAEDAL